MNRNAVEHMEPDPQIPEIVRNAINNAITFYNYRVANEINPKKLAVEMDDFVSEKLLNILRAKRPDITFIAHNETDPTLKEISKRSEHIMNPDNDFEAITMAGNLNGRGKKISITEPFSDQIPKEMVDELTTKIDKYNKTLETGERNEKATLSIYLQRNMPKQIIDELMTKIPDVNFFTEKETSADSYGWMGHVKQ